jgi:ferredoxin, 2Fe-2S
VPKITYVQKTGERQDIDVPVGHSLMEAAIDNSVEGIVAECGGACACATCHAYIDDAWLSKLPELNDMEDAMLDATSERRANSRLTCQIEMTDDLDGMVVHVAENNL